MGSAIARSIPHSLEDSDSDISNQIEGENNSHTLIRTEPIVATNSFSINAINKNKQQQNNEGTININNTNCWICSKCGLNNKTNTDKCGACFTKNLSITTVWCWKDNSGAYVQYPKSITLELNKLQIGNTYTIKIEKTIYEIKKISKTKCQQTNTKTKRKRLVIQQLSQLSSQIRIPHSQDNDAKVENQRVQQNNEQKQPISDDEHSIQSQLVLMGFEQQYIKRAFNVYKKNYGHKYNIEVITEIIVRLQNKDKKIQNKNTSNISTNDLPSLPLFNAHNVPQNNSKNVKRKIKNENIAMRLNPTQVVDNNTDSEMKHVNIKYKQPVHEWTSQTLKDWIYSLAMIPKHSRNKIINGIEEFKINAVDFYESQNGQEIADTFDIETNVGNSVFAHMQNIASPKKIKKRKRKICTTWKTKKVSKWSCGEIQDWVYSLHILGEEDKNKFMSEIEESHLTGADFVLCQNGADITDSFDGVSLNIGTLLYNQLNKVSSNLLEHDVRKLFYSCLSARKYTMVEIRQVFTEKHNIYEQILREKCQKAGQKRKLVEKYLWHGSKSVDNIKLICKNGFDRSYNKNSAYGKGTYFAKQVKYCVTKGYCGKDKSGVSFVLLCKVIVGECIIGNSTMKQIPRKPDGEEYDSLVNNALNPTIFVVWRDYHAIPHYLIKYKCSK